MKDIFINMKEEIVVLAFFTIVILALLSFSIFEVEHEAQPKVFTDIFQTLWWAVATLTTVGYGDMYPITPLGKLITGIVSIVGIAFVAIPGGMFASEFISHLSQKKSSDSSSNQASENCPHCGSSNYIILEKALLDLYNDKIKLNSIGICKDCKYLSTDV